MKNKFLSSSLFVFLFCIYCSANLFGQNHWLWSRSSTANGGEGYSVCTDSAGDIYITGAGGPGISFGSFFLSSGTPYLVKYDAAGNVLWARSGTGSSAIAYSVYADASGNAYITGYFESPITFGNFTLPSAGTRDLFVVKYDASGNVLWAKSAGGSNWDVGNSICADASGNVFVTGFFISPNITFGTTTLTNTSGTPDVFIVKYDSGGNVLWAQSTGGANNEYGNGVSADANGNVFLAGHFGSPSIVFGSNTLNNFGIENAFLVKYDANGNVLWATAASSAGSQGLSASADSFGNIYMAGWYYNSSVVFGSYTLPSSGGGNTFLVKYNSAGTVVWAKASLGSNSNQGYCVSADISGNSYVTGSFYSSTISFGNILLTAPVGSIDPMFIVKYDANGNALCGAALASGGDDANGVSADRYGNAYITGDFEPALFIVGNDTLSVGTANETIFTAKYSCDSIEDVNELNKKESISVFPNPFNSSAIMKFSFAMNHAELNIYDMYGQKIKTVSNISGDQFILERENLSQGFYFYEWIQGSEKIATGKFIVID
jgi:hypothetical protein